MDLSKFINDFPFVYQRYNADGKMIMRVDETETKKRMVAAAQELTSPPAMESPYSNDWSTAPRMHDAAPRHLAAVIYHYIREHFTSKDHMAHTVKDYDLVHKDALKELSNWLLTTITTFEAHRIDQIAALQQNAVPNQLTAPTALSSPTTPARAYLFNMTDKKARENGIRRGSL